MSTEQARKGRRRYRKRLRAEQEQRTRERITEAAVKLHSSIGPARTTVSGIAEEAGVQRATVYRHFPREEELFGACSAHYMARNPPPDPQTWASVADPHRRLRDALEEMYAYYRRTEPMLEKTTRDAALVPAMAAPVARFRDRIAALGAAIVTGRPARGSTRRRLEAAVAHALSFGTWQSLVRQQGLDEEEAAALMAAFVEAAGGARR